MVLKETMIHLPLLLLILDLNFPYLHLGTSFVKSVYRQSKKTSKTKTKWGFYLAMDGKISENYTNSGIWLNMSYMTGIYGRHRLPDT